MTTWDMPVGGLPFEKDVDAVATSSQLPPRGVFAEVPGFTPKYTANEGEREDDFRESLARLFLQVPNYTKLLNEFNLNTDTKRIAEVLAGTGTSDGAAASNTGGNGYIDFLLQNVQHGFQEKMQIVETLSDDHVAYFFGQGAPTFSYGGMLINTKQDDQAMNMLRLYRDLGRGTMLASRRTLISIRYDGLLVSGAMTSLSLGLSAESETAVPFSFGLLVKDVLLLPSPYGGLVKLTKSFVAGLHKGEYKPFDSGLPATGTSSVKVVMAPPLALIPQPKADATAPSKVAPNKNALEEMNKISGTRAAYNKLDEIRSRVIRR